MAMAGRDSHSSNASAPWRLLLAGALAGLTVVLSLPDPRSQPGTAGRAQLSKTLPPSQPGWQMQVDPKALGLSQARLGQLLSSLGNPITLPSMETDDSRLLNLEQIEGKPPAIVATEPTARRVVSDKIFGGGPSVVFEWSKRAYVIRGNLFHKVGTPNILAGHLVGALPFSGIQCEGPGFSLDQLGLVPPDVERLVAIDPTILRFPSLYRDAVQKEWDRWEFTPFQTIGNALGPCLVYMRWHGDSLFSLGLKDIPAVETAIAKRFPEAVIHTAATWSYGVRVRGFDPQGPAWAIRGDTLLASKSGGTARLISALTSAMQARESAYKDSPLLAELQRLGATEPGWHVVVMMANPDSPIHWAAALRWPEPTMTRVNGFLVVQLNLTDAKR